MEEIKQAGLQQEQEQPATESTEVTTEQDTLRQFWNEGGLSEEGEQPEGQQEGVEQPAEQEEQAQEQQQYYTPEEIRELGLEKLDPNRLPPELVPFYKSMQADYTRKTQALAEERKAIERVLDKALSHPELAREFMNDPELVGLAQRHPELAQKLQAVSQMAQPEQQDPYSSIAQEAAKEFKERYGEDFDPLDEKHVAAFQAIIAQKVAEKTIEQTFERQLQAVLEKQRQQEVLRKIETLRAEEPHFDEIDVYAQQKLLQLPFQKILELQQGGDEAILNFWEQCRKEWYQKNAVNQQAQQQQPTSPTPPPVEGGGNQQVPSEPSPEELLKQFWGGK